MEIQPTGAEKLATWINALNWLWLIIGVAGIYIGVQDARIRPAWHRGCPRFRALLPGKLHCRAVRFEWPALFVLGLILVGLELFVFPGTVLLGLTGAALMLITIVMAMVDIYPGMPRLPVCRN